MCQIWLRSNGRVEKNGGYRHTDRQTDEGTLQLYNFIVDTSACSCPVVIPNLLHGYHVSDFFSLEYLYFQFFLIRGGSMSNIQTNDVDNMAIYVNSNIVIFHFTE